MPRPTETEIISARKQEFDYQRYLASREWGLKKQAVHVRAGRYCERCKVWPIAAVHHLTYARLGHEELADPQAVCDGCHRWLSGISHHDPVVARMAEEALKAVEENDRHRAVTYFALAAQWMALDTPPVAAFPWMNEPRTVKLRLSTAEPDGEAIPA